MGTRYFFEISDGPSPYDTFSYFDTEEILARHLFAHLKVDVEIAGVFGNEEDPYRFVVCRVPRKDRENFMRALAVLPAMMAYAGHTDYDDYCRAVMGDVKRFLEGKEGKRGGTNPSPKLS